MHSRFRWGCSSVSVPKAVRRRVIVPLGDLSGLRCCRFFDPRLAEQYAGLVIRVKNLGNLTVRHTGEPVVYTEPGLVS